MLIVNAVGEYLYSKSNLRVYIKGECKKPYLIKDKLLFTLLKLYIYYTTTILCIDYQSLPFDLKLCFALQVMYNLNNKKVHIKVRMSGCV